MDIPVLDNDSIIMNQGRKSKCKRKRSEESQAPAAQDEPQVMEVEVSEEPEVTVAQPGNAPPTDKASSQPTKRMSKGGTKDGQHCFPDEVLDAFLNSVFFI